MLRFWRRHFLGVEAGAITALAAGLSLWILAGGEGSVEALLEMKRDSLYRTSATVAGTMFGLTIATSSVMIGTWSSERVSFLRQRERSVDIWKTVFQSMILFGVLTISAIVGLLWDTDKEPSVWVFVVYVFLGTLAIARIARVVWILANVINLVTRPVELEE